MRGTRVIAFQASCLHINMEGFVQSQVRTNTILGRQFGSEVQTLAEELLVFVSF